MIANAGCRRWIKHFHTRHTNNILIRPATDGSVRALGSEEDIIYQIDFDRSKEAVNKERAIFHDFSFYIGYISTLVLSSSKKTRLLDELNVDDVDDVDANNKDDIDDTYHDYWYSLCQAIAEPDIRAKLSKLSSVTFLTLPEFVQDLQYKCMLQYERRQSSRARSGSQSGGGRPTHPKKNTNPATNGATVILKSLGITTKQSLRSSLKHLEGLPISHQDRFVRKANRLNVPGNTPQEVVENAYRIQSTGISLQSAHPPRDWKNSCRDWVLFVTQVCGTVYSINAAKNAILNNPEHEMGVHRKPRRIVNNILQATLPAAAAVGLQFLKSKKKVLRRQQAAKSKRNASKKHGAKKVDFVPKLYVRRSADFARVYVERSSLHLQRI